MKLYFVGDEQNNATKYKSDEKNDSSTKTNKNISEIKENSNDNLLGPCCSTQRKEVTIMRPVDSKAIGPFCLGNADHDSPEETCGMFSQSVVYAYEYTLRWRTKGEGEPAADFTRMAGGGKI